MDESLLMFNFVELVLFFCSTLYHFYTEGRKLVICRELFELKFKVKGMSVMSSAF